MCVSDGSLLPLLLAKAKADLPSLKNLYTVESSSHCYRVTKEVCYFCVCVCVCVCTRIYLFEVENVFFSSCLKTITYLMPSMC